MRPSKHPLPTTIGHWVIHIISQGPCFLFHKKVILNIGCIGYHHDPTPRYSDLIDLHVAWTLGFFFMPPKWSQDATMLKTTVTRGKSWTRSGQQTLTHLLPLPSSHPPTADPAVNRRAPPAKPKCCLTLFINTTAYTTTANSWTLAQGTRFFSPLALEKS